MDTAITFCIVLIIFILLIKTSQFYNQTKSKNNTVIIYFDDKWTCLSYYQTRYLNLTGIKDKFITNRSIFIGGKYLLYDKLTTAIITPLEFSNNRSNLSRILRLRNFLFQPTNFIT
jgi:hypothetical protein